MSEKKKNLKDVVLEFEPTEVDVTQKNSLKMLRYWAMKTAKESFWILVTYSIWAWLLLYSFDRAGYSGLAISITIALLYRLSRIESAIKGKRL